ncbi:MAG: hypothetical protein ACKOC8_03280 [Pirellulales bacterium]
MATLRGILTECVADRRAAGARLVAVGLMLTGWASTAVAAERPSGFRPLAPGVLTVIPADRTTDDALLRADILEITKGQADLAWAPKTAAANTTFVERARSREYPRDIWCLEFAFKPPRLLDVDVPATAEQMQRKRIWYLVYRVKNVGGRRVLAAEGEDGKDADARKVETFEAPVRFLPHFVLESLEPVEDGEGLASYRSYLDRLVPSAMDAIRRREDPRRTFFDSAEISASDIAPGEERWGVAIWENVDPRVDFFSIYIRGLTNAIRWRQKPGSVIKAGDPPGSDIEETLESLRLDFWRPGDDREGGDRQMGIGFAGMFERMALGGRLLAATGWPRRAEARPLEGLDALGLGWADLLEPDAGDGGASLAPLEAVLRTAASLRDRGDPIESLRLLFGDLGVKAIDDLVAAAAGPVEEARDRTRRAALETAGLTPDAVAQKPLESLATIMRVLESNPDAAARQAAAAQVFGPAARRVSWLADAVVKARTLATLRVIDADVAEIGGTDALAAFDALRPAIDGLGEAERKRIVDTMSTKTKGAAERRKRLDALPVEARTAAVNAQLLAGLFGPRGPALYAAAVAVNQGIDHAWVFRYETEVGGL